MLLKDRIAALQRQRGLLAPRRDLGAAPPLRDTLRQLIARREGRGTRTLAPPAGEAIAPGLYRVEQRLPAPSLPAFAPLPWGEAECVARERLVCFDTETTGLAGGVGTKAFMIGWSVWQDDALVLRQLYLTALGGEAAMLDAFAAALPADAVFVSYNGRSYDAPLLKGRYRINRQAHPFEARAHVDLLYPVRRRFRGVWCDCKLQTIERQVLGIVREDDLPGAQAPAAWLAFLRGAGSRALGRVLEHNRQDLVTLARLFGYLVETSAVAEAGARA